MSARVLVALAAFALAVSSAACVFSGHEGRVYSAPVASVDPEAQALPRPPGPRPEIKDPVATTDGGARP